MSGMPLWSTVHAGHSSCVEPTVQPACRRRVRAGAQSGEAVVLVAVEATMTGPVPLRQNEHSTGHSALVGAQS